MHSSSEYCNHLTKIHATLPVSSPPPIHKVVYIHRTIIEGSLNSFAIQTTHGTREETEKSVQITSVHIISATQELKKRVQLVHKLPNNNNLNLRVQ